MNARAVRSWLLKQPRPISLRLTVGDEVSTMAINGDSWASIAASVEAMDPDLVEALDEKGQLIRATRGNEASELEADGVPRAAAPALAMIDVGTLQLVAKLLADAYKHSNEVAFARLADLFTASNRRSENLEKSLATAERMLRKQFEEQIEQQAEAQGADGGLLGQMVHSLVAGASNAASSPPPPNGKGHS